MAEGGDFGYDDPDLDRKFDNYDDEDENEVTRDGYDSERGKEYRSPDLPPPTPLPPTPKATEPGLFSCQMRRLYGLRKITSNRF